MLNCSLTSLYLAHLLYVALSNVSQIGDDGLHLKTALILAISMTLYLTWSLEYALGIPLRRRSNEENLLPSEHDEGILIKKDIAYELGQSDGYFLFNLFFVVMFASMLLTDFGRGLSSEASAQGAGTSGMFMIIVFQWGSAFFFFWKLLMPAFFPRRRDVLIQGRGVLAFDLWAPASKFYRSPLRRTLPVVTTGIHHLEA